VTAAVSKLLYDSPFPGGIYHIEQITDLAYVHEELGATLSLDIQVKEHNADKSK
jgi:hypothetical protein